MAHYENIICDSNSGIFWCVIFGVLSKLSGDDSGLWLLASGLGSTGSHGLVLIGIPFRDLGHTHGELVCLGSFPLLMQ